MPVDLSAIPFSARSVHCGHVKRHSIIWCRRSATLAKSSRPASPPTAHESRFDDHPGLPIACRANYLRRIRFVDKWIYLPRRVLAQLQASRNIGSTCIDGIYPQARAYRGVEGTHRPWPICGKYIRSVGEPRARRSARSGKINSSLVGRNK
jgi:hypothetical protein